MNALSFDNPVGLCWLVSRLPTRSDHVTHGTPPTAGAEGQGREEQTNTAWVQSKPSTSSNILPST